MNTLQSAVEPEIFIQIASYRDPQLGGTIRSLIAQASAPQRLRLGLCIQVGEHDHLSCGLPSLPAAHELRGATLKIDLVTAEASRGVCWARARTQTLWNGEPFILQIDSHMCFAAGWDQELLQSWARCADPKAILSCYPNAFKLPDHCDTEQLPVLGAQRFDEHGILRLHGINRFRYPDEVPDHPLPTAMVAAGLLFGPAEWLQHVPYDPELYFYGEEISLALRLWTHGFNFYNPDRLLIFHLYKTSGNGSPTHWADHSSWSEYNARSLARVKALTHGHHVEAPFGLGTVRTLQEWQEWSGVNLQELTISDHAQAGQKKLDQGAPGLHQQISR